MMPRLRHFGSPQPSWKRQAIHLLGATLVTAVVGIGLFGDPVRHRQSVRWAIASELPVPWQSIDLAGLIAMVDKTNVLLVDARYASDFQTGSFRSAVNIPYHISRFSIGEILFGVDKQTEIVIFCQSSMCGFSAILAEKLVANGFRRVIVAKEGVNEFREATRVNEGSHSGK